MLKSHNIGSARGRRIGDMHNIEKWRQGERRVSLHRAVVILLFDSHRGILACGSAASA
jgi:hypothetical protein